MVDSRASQLVVGLGILAAVAMSSTTAESQSPSVSVVQSSDGTLYLAQGGNVWTVLPNTISDSDLASLNPSGELDGAIPDSILGSSGVPAAVLQVVQGSDGSIYVVRGSRVWTLVPDRISDADLAALTYVGEVDGAISWPDFGPVQAAPSPTAAAALPTPSPTAVAYEPLQIPHSAPRLAAISHAVLPHDTDPAIDDALTPHLASVAPSCDQASGYLVVFLPGTGGKGTGPDAVQMVSVATQDCLHGISLSYPDTTAGAIDCLRDPDPDCFEKWRLQKLDGVQRSPHLTTTPPNSIENRLLKLLGYLVRTYPAENWGTYLDDTGVRWDHVVVAGMSQGGGMAAIIGHVHFTARVVMFGSITDAVGGISGPSPAWVSKPSATPANRYFGFAHMRDAYWPAEQKNWAALTLNQFGTIVNVDSATPPYSGSHTLTTDIAFNESVQNGAHATVVLPRNAGVFGKVWEYLLVSG